MTNLDEYLSGDKKRLLLITRDGCPYARKFHNEINKAFKERDISSYYTKDIKTT
jgi:thioredoxin-related protein